MNTNVDCTKFQDNLVYIDSKHELWYQLFAHNKFQIGISQQRNEFEHLISLKKVLDQEMIDNDPPWISQFEPL